MKKYVTPGDVLEVTLPFSEVCMHMRVAGTERWIRIAEGPAVQILNDDMTPFSFPITMGEGGFYWDGTFEGKYYMHIQDSEES